MVVDQRLPGLLAELCGVEVEDYDSLSSQMQNSLEFMIPELSGACATVGVLFDILKPTSATVVARYTQDYYAGNAAITLNQFGRGRAVYVGAVGDAELYDLLAKWLLNASGLHDTFVTPAGVEVAQRIQGNKDLYFILNHNSSSEIIHLKSSYIDLLSRKQLQGDIHLAPFDVLILTSSNLEQKTQLSA